MAEQSTLPAVAAHGSLRLPAVEIDSYNVEVKDDEGFIGDRASGAVAQGLSEVPFMQDVERWGVITIGTGLGNARFTNRHPD